MFTAMNIGTGDFVIFNETKSEAMQEKEEIMSNLEKKAREFIENVLLVNLEKKSKGIFMNIGSFGGKLKYFFSGATATFDVDEEYDALVVNNAVKYAKDYGICSKLVCSRDCRYPYGFWMELE